MSGDRWLGRGVCGAWRWRRRGRCSWRWRRKCRHRFLEAAGLRGGSRDGRCRSCRGRGCRIPCRSGSAWWRPAVLLRWRPPPSVGTCPKAICKMKVFPFFERERERTVLLVLLLFNAAGVIVRVLEFSGFWFATSMLACHILCYYGHSGRNSLF